MPRSKATAPTVGERTRYWFDNWMSRGPVALIALLGLATVGFVFVLALVVMVFQAFPADGSGDFWDILWGNLMRTLDPGTMGGDEGWPFRIAMLVVTIGGLIIVASLIGIVSGGFDAKVDELRKGRSRVLETDHTLVLGWSSKVFPILAELCIANESRRKPVIVLLADRDKVEMEDAIRAELPDPGRTRIIVRSGDPMNLTDLEIANPHTARSIVILAPEESDDPDAVVIKTALALTNNPRRGSERYHIVGELQDAANLEAATLVGRDEAHWVLATDLISRITVQTCRQSGLSVVYTELLDFDGDEIYFSRHPELAGRTYFDAQLSFSDCTVIGLVLGGRVLINPPGETVISANDQLILIAEDDSTIRLGTPVVPATDAIVEAPPIERVPERTLVLGYNRGLHAMLAELDEYVASGSLVTVVADVEAPAFDVFESLRVEFERGDTTSRRVLDGLGAEGYDHVIVLATEGLDVQRADARTLITLLHLRDIGERTGADLSIVSEMLDDLNRELAEVTNADDFIVSDKLISLMLSQVSENRQLTEVFDLLFSAEGSEIYLRQADLYVAPGVEIDFYTVLEAARRRGETALGYRLAEHAHTGSEAYGVRVNPLKSERFALGAGDHVIVLAEE